MRDRSKQRSSAPLTRCATVLSWLLLTSGAWAQDEYSAKALFFDTNNKVVATGAADPVVETSAPAASLADTAASSPDSNSAQQSPHRKTTTAAHRKSQGGARLGVSYFIRIQDSDGTTHDALASRAFRSGEHFQLGIKVNQPAYVYVFNEAPDGAMTQIYPQPSQDNFVNAMGVVFLPGRGSFQFDNQRGVEKLFVYMSPERQRQAIVPFLKTATPDFRSEPADLAQVAASAKCPSPPVASADSGSAPQDAAQKPMRMAAAGESAAKGISYSASTCSTDADATQVFAAKGIVYSDDGNPGAGGQVASYVVKEMPTPQAKLLLKISLVHQ